MKKTVSIIVIAVLSISLMLGLSACTIDIKTGDKNNTTYTIDLGDFNLDQLKDTLENIDFEGISDDIEQKGEEVSNFLDAFSGDLGEVLAGLESELSEQNLINDNGTDSISGITDDAESIRDAAGEIADSFSEDKEDGLKALEKILEQYGLGEYYDQIAQELEKDPEVMNELINSGQLEQLLNLISASLGMSSSGEAAEPAEPADTTETAETAEITEATEETTEPVQEESGFIIY